jgi:hypothetical protein
MYGMSDDEWRSVRDGETLGEPGSEDGVIVADDEHPAGARITIERDGRIAPFAITCGVYGWMVHTRFFSEEQSARDAMRVMKEALGALALDPSPEASSGFVQKFP